MLTQGNVPKAVMHADVGHGLRSLMRDDYDKRCFFYTIADETSEAGYFSDVVHHEAGSFNWAFQEMWTYFHKKFPQYTMDDMKRHWKQSRSHVLEVYCSEQSQLTRQGEALGMITFHFGLKHGDLAMFPGRCRLYESGKSDLNIYMDFPEIRFMEQLEQAQRHEVHQMCPADRS